jgi:uncharacterized protein (TIGR02246 family)
MAVLTLAARRAAFMTAVAVSLLAKVPLQAEDGATLASEIDAMHVRYLSAFNRRDAAALAALFTEDGVFVDGAGKIIAGRADIEAMFAVGFGGADLVLEADADRIGPIGDGAWDVGHGAQIIKSAAGMQRMPLHYAAVYTRLRGALKLRVVTVGAE